MKKVTILTALVFSMVMPLVKAEDNIVLSQPDSPLEIVEYRSLGFDRSITHVVDLRNQSGKEIIAYQMGLISFSIFNEFLDRLGGYAVENLSIDEEKTSTWESRESNASLHYTGVAYVSKVRFSDGVIWEADHLAAIMPQLREIADDLELEDLGL